jgi:hypothetical protein
MTARELFDYLMECCDKGFGDADVFVCDKRENPLTDGICVCGAIRIEEKDGEKSVIITTG